MSPETQNPDSTQMTNADPQQTAVPQQTSPAVSQTQQEQIPVRVVQPTVIQPSIPAASSPVVPSVQVEQPPVQSPTPPVAQPTNTQTLPAMQQPVGFKPAGFEQAHFLQESNSTAGGLTPKKKKFFSSKAFVVTASILAFVVVLGGAFAYNMLWLEDKAPVLANYKKTSELRSELQNKVHSRFFTNTQFFGTEVGDETDKLRHDANEKLLARTRKSIEAYKEEVDKYNKLRDPDFAKEITEYSDFIGTCVDYISDLNEDYNTFGPLIKDTRLATKPIEFSNPTFSNASEDEQKEILKKTKLDYETLKKRFSDTSFDTKEVQAVSVALQKALDKNMVVIDDFVTGRVIFLGNARSFSSPELDASSTAVSTQLNDGICASEADENLSEMFEDFDFSEEDKELLKTLEIFE